jgi:hypothetical protein
MILRVFGDDGDLIALADLVGQLIGHDRPAKARAENHDMCHDFSSSKAAAVRQHENIS